MKKLIWETFHLSAEKYPDKTAVVCGDERITYGCLEKMSCILGDWIRKCGGVSGSNIGLLMEKSIDFCMTLLALLRIGSAAVPLSTYFNGQEVLNACRITDTDLVLVDEKVYRRIGQAVSAGGCRCVSVSQWRSLNQKNADMSEVLQDNSRPKSGADDHCLILMTSGSTGQPKAAVIGQEAMRFRTELECLHFGLTEKDRVLISTPIYHSLGVRLLLTALCRGMTTILTVGFSPKTWLETVSRDQITYTITVPAQIAQILEYLEKHRIDGKEKMKSIRTILSTSSFLDQKYKKAFLELVSGRFINFIASSETEFIAWSDCSWEDPEGNLLGEPFPATEILISKDGRPAAPGETGEILCKSRQLFEGYYGNPELTARSMWNGYYRTGDLGFFDDKRRLHYAGREKNLIICSGVNIVPRDVEQALLECPGVKECVAFGIPDDKFGEIVGVLLAGDGITEKEIKRFALKRLTVYQQPRKIFITDKIPRNEMGKVVMQKIKECYR